MGKTEIAPQIDWNKDKLGIKDNVIGFANILKQEKYTQDGTSKVYSISAEFGIGKTFFCERLQDVLKQDNTPVSMLNIWKMDFYENPLVPLLINLQQTYTQYSNTSEAFPNPTKLLNVLKTIVAGISIEAKAPFFGKIVIDGEKMVNCHETLKKNAKDNGIYAEYEQFEEELNKLKSFLANWAKKTNKPIVIIIDELDRCRPDYAIKTLEVLKHFFDIPGFVFVLAIDEEQLKNSVETLFGTKNFDGYKRKFINNAFVLPAPDRLSFTDFLYEKTGMADIIKTIEEQEKDLLFKIRRDIYQDHINKYFYGTAHKEEINKCIEFNKLQTSESIIKRYFTAYSTWFKFTLRQMEQTFDRLVLFTKTFIDGEMLFSPDLSVFLVCLHEFDLKLYSKLRERNKISSTERLFSVLIGAKTSIAFKLYDTLSFDKINILDRSIIPPCPHIPNFSTSNGPQPILIAVSDNVERFFIHEEGNELKWIRDAVIEGSKNPIDNNGRIGIIHHSSRESNWVEKEPDIDTESNFNLQTFKQNYFEKIDFISSFK